MVKEEVVRLRLSGELKDGLQKAADKVGLSSSEVVRQAVEAYVGYIEKGMYVAVNGRLLPADMVLLPEATPAAYARKVAKAPELRRGKGGRVEVVKRGSKGRR